MSSESFLALSSSTSSTSSSSTGRTSTEVVLAGLGRTRTPAVTLVVLVVLVILVILVVPVGLEDRRKYSFSTCRPQRPRIPKAPKDRGLEARRRHRSSLAGITHASSELGIMVAKQHSLVSSTYASAAPPSPPSPSPQPPPQRGDEFGNNFLRAPGR